MFNLFDLGPKIGRICPGVIVYNFGTLLLLPLRTFNPRPGWRKQNLLTNNNMLWIIIQYSSIQYSYKKTDYYLIFHKVSPHITPVRIHSFCCWLVGLNWLWPRMTVVLRGCVLDWLIRRSSFEGFLDPCTRSCRLWTLHWDLPLLLTESLKLHVLWEKTLYNVHSL